MRWFFWGDSDFLLQDVIELTEKTMTISRKKSKLR